MILTYPKNWKDKWVWPLIKIVWEPFMLKHSHWWHWLPYKDSVLQSITVQGNPKFKSRTTLWDEFFQTNIAWHKAVLLQPKDYMGLYRLGFRSVSEQKNEICSILLKGKAAALVGSQNLEFFAISYP